MPVLFPPILTSPPHLENRKALKQKLSRSLRRPVNLINVLNCLAQPLKRLKEQDAVEPAGEEGGGSSVNGKTGSGVDCWNRSRE